VSGLRTEYEFVLPRGYLDDAGTLHKRGVMRLATARDELQPLRDPTVTSADDPRITILVLARVIVQLGTVDMVTSREIEDLFAADLAYLQDFYGIINFGTDDEIDALLAAQAAGDAVEPELPAKKNSAERGSGEERSSRRRDAIEEVPSSRR
jgi:hypothetical protein